MEKPARRRRLVPPLRRHPWLSAVFATGLVARAALIPITHGQDFVVWDLASRATLAGINIYAHHPAYPGGPYTYTPLFLDLELPMQWISLHCGIHFTIMGKLPIMAGDVLTAAVLGAAMRRQGRGDRLQAVAAGLFFLNPLVLYNGAFYGRFDSVCIGLFALAVHLDDRSRHGGDTPTPIAGEARGRHRLPPPAGWGTAATFGLAVAAKTFPLVILPRLLLRGRITAIRVAAAGALIVGGVSAPYLLTSPGAFLTDVTRNVGVLGGSLAWQSVFHHVLAASVQIRISEALLAVFVLVMVALSRIDDLTLCAAVATLLFLVFSKVVIEQYLTWPLPFLIVLAVDRRSRAAATLLAALTAVGMLVNPYIHPFGTEPAVMDVLLAALIVAGSLRLVLRHGAPATATRTAQA
ncbi:MAG: glycosyltransferase 87 family protein [Candidatus Dormibacteria bacterium]|jgi:hypothetical protein